MTDERCKDCLFWRRELGYCGLTLERKLSNSIACASYKTIHQLDDEFRQKVLQEKATKEALLKPCPFCGEKAKIREDYFVNNRYGIFCEKCHIGMGNEYGLEGIVEAWNKRAVKHGAWIRRFDTLECSECGYTVDCREESNYCPMCGAKME